MLAITLCPIAAQAQLTLGAAGGYTVVSLANGKTIGVNSGPNTGNFLLGQGVTAAFSGGGGGSIGGILFYDNTVLGINTFSQLATPPVTSLVPTATTVNAFNNANALSTYAQGLAATQTFGTLSSATSIFGNGGLNVISLGGIQNASVTLSGSANDIFVFNVGGNIQTNKVITLSGVSPSNILFNFLGTSGNVFQTSGGNILFGTFLATRGGNFQFSNLALTGSLVNTAGNIQLVSGSAVTFAGFNPTAVVPEPAVVILEAVGLALLFGVLRRRKRVA